MLKDEKEWLLPTEKEIIQVYRDLDDGRKECIQETLGYFKESIKKKKWGRLSEN